MHNSCRHLVMKYLARNVPVISSWIMIRVENEEEKPGLLVLPVNPFRLLVANAGKIKSPTNESKYVCN